MANSNASKSAVYSAHIAFIDLEAQQARIRPRIDAAIKRVLDHGQYIMGPEITAFESDLRAFCGARHAITCANGTEALQMVLMAQGVGPGDAVICPAFTFTATPEAIAVLGATTIFADVRADTFNLDPACLKDALDAATKLGLKPRGIMAVDLFGLPADYDAIVAFANDHDLFVIADAAQGFGAETKGRKVGTLGTATCTSFFPAKPLGCYGDGGAIFTEDDALAETLRSIRVHGKGTDKYDNVRIGLNARLDTLQAAILIEKLAIFADEIAARQVVAQRYAEALAGAVAVPHIPNDHVSVYAQYTIRLPAGQRDSIAKALTAQGIPTAIYYPKALNHQTAYRSYPLAAGGVPVAERLPGEVLSLPMHPYLVASDQNRVIDALLTAVRMT